MKKETFLAWSKAHLEHRTKPSEFMQALHISLAQHDLELVRMLERHDKEVAAYLASRLEPR